MIVRAVKGSGLTGAVRYVMGEQKRGAGTAQSSRIGWYGGGGFGFAIDSAARVETARRMMEFAAQHQTGRTKKCTRDALHLMLSWDTAGRPPRAEMEAAAYSVLAGLGMGQARFVMAAHTDTEHAHLHLVASRIDPDTGKAFRDSYDKTALSKWARDYEAAHGGIVCQRRQGKAPQKRRKDSVLEAQAPPIPVVADAPVVVAASVVPPIGGTTEQPGELPAPAPQPEPAAPSLPVLSADSQEIEAERAMLRAEAAPWREQIMRDGRLHMNGQPAWWQPVIAFAVYLQQKLNDIALLLLHTQDEVTRNRFL